MVNKVIKKTWCWFIDGATKVIRYAALRPLVLSKFFHERARFRQSVGVGVSVAKARLFSTAVQNLAFSWQTNLVASWFLLEVIL
jgi:hypothetical protein